MNPYDDIVDRSFEASSFDDLLEDLQVEIQARNYRITRINHIDNIHDRLEAGIEASAAFKHYKIVEFCNLNSCAELISANLRAGLFMPVRFIVYQVDDASAPQISFLKPTAFADLFDSSGVYQVARELENDMMQVLDELDY